MKKIFGIIKEFEGTLQQSATGKKWYYLTEKIIS